MKYILFFIVLSSYTYGQESRFRIVHEENISDTLIKQTGELMIFNNRGHQICLSLSLSFDANIIWIGII